MAAITIQEIPGQRLIDGSDINTIIAAVNAIADGTGTGTYTGSFTLSNGSALKTDTTTAHTGLIQAYDVDGAVYKTFATLTNGNTPALAIAAPSGGTVTIDGAVIGGTTAAAGTFSTISSSGSHTFTTAASGIILKQGANGKCGTVTLSAGAATVSNTSVAISDTIILSLNTVGGTIASQPYVATITASTGFTIAGGGGSNTSVYNYSIISNAA